MRSSSSGGILPSLFYAAVRTKRLPVATAVASAGVMQDIDRDDALVTRPRMIETLDSSTSHCGLVSS
jgi:hypothetical protein